MTLGVINSAPADRDIVFSNALRTHAKALELSARMPVGLWDYGQGVRRAKGQAFFWYLAKDEFLPLGLHHPVTLVTIEDDSSAPPQNFSTDLVSVFPQLAEWKWTLLSPNHVWFKQAHTRLMQESCTLSSPIGWAGFAELSQLTAWSVQLSNDVMWVASSQPLPIEGLAAQAERAWLKVFLSKDALGPEGRLQELRTLLSETFSHSQISGLSVTLPGSHAQLASQGLDCEMLDAHSVRLHFPLSFLKQDLQGIAELFAQKG